jgi:putative molybdopterin biosynthesis protein
MHDSEVLVGELLRAGARGYLLKSGAKQHLISAVALLANHQPFFYRERFASAPQQLPFERNRGDGLQRARPRSRRPADLLIIGSHCIGLDMIIERLQAQGLAVKVMNIGSTGGLAAAKRGKCDVAPIHLMDPASGEYNLPLLTPDLKLVPGYRRLEGIVFRKGDRRFEARSAQEAVETALAESDCLMVSRNAGSGTRILLDGLLKGRRPAGYWSQPETHNAVAVAVVQNRADWGVTIDSVARRYDLGFIALQDEHYDFVVPKAGMERPSVLRFRALLEDTSIRESLAAAGFRI